MENYIDLAGLFEFSDEWDISFDEKNECVVIDNIYKNPLEILSWLKSQDYPLWKYIDPEKTRNTKDYLDCRLNHAWPYNYGEEDMVAIENVCKKYLGRQEIDVLNRSFEFNCFKALEKKTNTEQHFPHLDDDQKIPIWIRAVMGERTFMIMTFLTTSNMKTCFLNLKKNTK